MIYFFYLKGGEGMEILWTCGEDDEGRVVKDIARKRLHLSGALWKRIKWNGIFSLNGEALHNRSV